MATINPKTWLALNLNNTSQQQVFLRQLVEYLEDQFTAANIANLFNGKFALLASSLTVSGTNLGTLASNRIFNCNGALINVVVFTFTAAITLTLSNLPFGAMVVIAATSGSTGHALKLAAKDLFGVPYQAIAATFNGTGTSNDMINTGLTFAASASITFVGGTLPGSSLYLVSA